MNWRKNIFVLITSLLLVKFCFAEAIVIIGSPGLAKIDAATVQRLYMGRAIEIDGTPVSVINAAENTPLRRQFLNNYIEQDEEKYIAYWRVRQFIGKGRPPRNVDSAATIITQVQNNKDRVGYIFVSEVTPELNVIFRK